MVSAVSAICVLLAAAAVDGTLATPSAAAVSPYAIAPPQNAPVLNPFVLVAPGQAAVPGNTNAAGQLPAAGAGLGSGASSLWGGNPAAGEMNPYANAASPPLPPLVATRQTTFAIPFRIEAAAEPGREPVEVQLLVSTDRGANWQLGTKTDPRQQQFVYRAPADGEYWFQVKTLDRAGRVQPPGPPSPGLRVLVDTQPPQVALRLERGEGGQLTAHWEITDADLRADTLQLQYRVGSSAWMPIAIDRAALPATGPARGETTWWPMAGTGDVQLRADVTDAAGNTAVSQASLAGMPASAAANVAASNIAGSDASATSGNADSVGPGSFAKSTSPQQNLPPQNASPTAAFGQSQTAQATGRLEAVPWPVDRYEAGLPSAAPPIPVVAGPQYAAAVFAPATTAVTAAATAATAAGSSIATGASVGAADGAPAAPIPVSSNARPASGLPLVPVSLGIAAAGAPAISAAVMPGSARTRPASSDLAWVRQTKFEVHYDAGAPPSAIQYVELWARCDAQPQWHCIAVDGDRQSPIVATVPGDGVYGLRVVVHLVGRPCAPPQPNDTPQMSIGVDQTPPTAELLSAIPGTGVESGALVLSYTAADDHLAPTPITIQSAPSPDGPWREIAVDQPNTGRYAWRPAADAPFYAYLRLIVRDAAGNTTTVAMPSPVSLEAVRAMSQARETRSLRQAVLAQPRRYIFR